MGKKSLTLATDSELEESLAKLRSSADDEDKDKCIRWKGPAQPHRDLAAVRLEGMPPLLVSNLGCSQLKSKGVGLSPRGFHEE